MFEDYLNKFEWDDVSVPWLEDQLCRSLGDIEYDKKHLRSILKSECDKLKASRFTVVGHTESMFNLLEYFLMKKAIAARNGV